MATSLRELLASTPLSGGNAPYVEALYEQFLADPQSVEPAWRDYFQLVQHHTQRVQVGLFRHGHTRCALLGRQVIGRT